ncbi:YraN family protein [Candidatus Parcubacteria bacterium]|nr:YraN family protein [Candidatus Parcubacteria bacterium]
MDTKELGNLGEKLAAEYLAKEGFKILEKNWRIPFGEIDIIAKKKWRLFGRDPTIHFVEVKTIITSDGFFPEQRADHAKQRKLRQLCLIWLQKKKFPLDHSYQINVIGVSIDPLSEKPEIEYFDNVVEEGY